MISIFTRRTEDHSGSRKRSKPTSRNHYRPRPEWLEDRLAPAPALLTSTVNLDQFANNAAIWRNGDLNRTNSAYHEGGVVPFRLSLVGLTPGASDSIHLNYDFTSGGHEGYDFLATYNATETGVNAFASGSGNTALDPTILAFEGTTPVTVAFPPDLFVPNPANGLTVSGAQTFSGVGQNLTIFGATNVSITPAAGPTHSGPTGANSTGDLVANFTPTPGGNGSVFLVWGGHLAQSAYWDETAGGSANGASLISGASLHMRTQNLTDNGVTTGSKNQDRSIRPSAIVSNRPTITTTATPTSGGVGARLTDSATLAGGLIPAGTITFTLTLNGTTVDTETAPVNGNGTYSTPTGFVPTATGTYQWVASYSGDTNNNPVASTAGSEPVTVTKYSPAISTTASAGGVVGQVTLNDTAHLSGGFNPTGSILFTLTAPDGSTAYTQTVTVNGNADYSTSPGVLAMQAGTYTWSAVYSGDANNNPVTSTSGDEPVVVSPPSPSAPQADLALSKTVNPTAPNVGDTVTFTVTLSNAGPDPATGVQVSDPFPSGLQFVSATPSQGTYDPATGLWSVGAVSTHAAPTLTITAKVISPTAETNSAAITHSDQFDPDPANNRAGATVTPQQADLAVFKSVSNPTPNVGETITYTITLDNGGPDPATGVVVGDTLPTGVTYVSSSASQGAYDPTTNLWTVGDVKVATPQTLVITATVVSAASIANTASIAKADQFDPYEGNNSDTTSIVPQEADLGLVKSVNNPRPNVGETVTFTVMLVNSGPAAATGVVVADPLPAGLQFVSAKPSEGTYDSTTGTWTVGGVAVGAPQTLTITAKVVNPARETNTATITRADQVDPDLSNNSNSRSIDPQQADLALFKSVSAVNPNAGETVTFIVGLRNQGPNDATGVTVSDPLPAGLQFVSATPSQGTYDPATGLWSVGAVSTHAAPTLTITAKVISPTAETNSAAITHSDQFDPDPANNRAGATVTPPPALTVTNLQRFGFHHQPTALILTFDRPLDPARAELTSNYRLVVLFHGGRLRVPVAIASAVYDPTQNTVTLTPKPHGRPFLPLHREYELTVVGTGGSGLTAADGTPLAGRGGVPGTDAVRQFQFEILAGSNRPGAPHKPFERPHRHTDPHGQAGVHRVHLRHGSRAVHVRLAHDSSGLR